MVAWVQFRLLNGVELFGAIGRADAHRLAKFFAELHKFFHEAFIHLALV